MQTDYILKADLLDIIFDNRNKQYGAYDLRRYYPMRLYKSIGITFLFAALLLSFTLFDFGEQLVKTSVFEIGDPALGKVLPPELPKPAAAVKPSVPNQPKTSTQLFTSTVEIVQDPAKATKLATNLDSVIISSETSTVPPGGPGPVVPAPPNPGPTTGNGPAPVKIDREQPLSTAEIMPSYPGGMNALRNFLQKHLHNPGELEEGTIASVKIKFIVGYDGKLKGFETVEDGGAAFNNEVIRVLKKMPEWVPGKSNGENVSVYYTIPVKFTAPE